MFEADGVAAVEAAGCFASEPYFDGFADLNFVFAGNGTVLLRIGAESEVAAGVGDGGSTRSSFGRGDDDDLRALDGIAVEGDDAGGGDGFGEMAGAGAAAG